MDSLGSQKRPRLDKSDSIDSIDCNADDSVTVSVPRVFRSLTKKATYLFTLQDVKKGLRGKYRCGRCGQQKSNHICNVEAKNVYVYTTATQVEIGPIDLSCGVRTLTVRSVMSPAASNSTTLK